MLAAGGRWIVSERSPCWNWDCLRGCADSPAVVYGFDDGFELVLGGSTGSHDLDEGEEKGAVFFGGPLRCHV